ncbi:MAG: SOS response-associated peptidase, partial [Xanthobacteraceae bacterium]
IVPPEAFDFWLDPNADTEMAAAIIAPAPNGLLDSYPVSSAVNRVANDTPDLLAPLSEEMGEAAVPAPKPKRAKKEKEVAKKDDGQASLF